MGTTISDQFYGEFMRIFTKCHLDVLNNNNNYILRYLMLIKCYQ